MRHLVNMIEELKERGIGFRSISDGMIDTTSASGELVLNIFSALAERRLIQEGRMLVLLRPERVDARAVVGRLTVTIPELTWPTSYSATSQPSGFPGP